jgi:hypothetical protein
LSVLRVPCPLEPLEPLELPVPPPVPAALDTDGAKNVSRFSCGSSTVRECIVSEYAIPVAAARQYSIVYGEYSTVPVAAARQYSIVYGEYSTIPVAAAAAALRIGPRRS